MMVLHVMRASAKSQSHTPLVRAQSIEQRCIREKLHQKPKIALHGGLMLYQSPLVSDLLVGREGRLLNGEVVSTSD